MSLNKEIVLNLNMKIAMSSLVVFLTACGDSSDDNVAKELSGENSELISISSSNMEQAVTVATNSIFNNMALATADGFTGVIVEESTSPINVINAEWVFSHLNKSVNIDDSFTGVISSNTEECEVSGNMEFTFDLANPFGLSVNDSVTFTSNNCDDGLGVTNGSFTMQYTEIEDFVSLNDFSILGLNVTFDSYSIDFDDEEIVIDGQYSLVINKNIYTETVDITSDKLSISIPNYQTTIEDLVINEIYTDNTNIKTLNASNTVTDGLLGGSVNVQTTEDFEYFSRYSNTPSSGVMVITGADSSSVTITVLTSNSVQLDADYDGDNTIDNTITTTWNALTF